MTPFDISDSFSNCEEEFESDDDERPDKPQATEETNSTLMGQKQYHKFLKHAEEVRTSFLNRKQVRYLGIVIEKDEEYKSSKPDIRRVYIPTKGKYMEIVKAARVKYVDSQERIKGLGELPKTLRRLNRK